MEKTQMAEKVSTLVITVDLLCSRSFRKIRKTLCKLQESEDISAIRYDDKAGTVTVSGGFDPLVLPCKLRRRAGCVIKDIRLKKETRKKDMVPPPLPLPLPLPPLPTHPASRPIEPAYCSVVCHHCHCHCGGGCGCRCCCCAAVNAAPGYGGSMGGGCSGIQFLCYDEPSPACSIM